MGKASRKKRTARASDAGFSPAEIAAVTGAAKSAGSTNPRVVRDAFLAGPVRVGDLEILPFSTGRYMLLEQIDSPFIRESKPGEENKAPENIETLEALYVMTQPAEAILELLARHGGGSGGRVAFRHAVMLFADTVPLADLPQAGAALRLQFTRALSTVIGSPASSGEDAGAGAAEKKSSPAPVVSPESPANRTASGGH